MADERGRPSVVVASRFREASDERWEDAQCLHRAERFDGAIYLCGYVLECFLKYVLCERRKQPGLELKEAQKFGHKLSQLMDATELGNLLSENKDLWLAFQSMNNQWSVEIRYWGKKSARGASETFLRDTQDLRNWLQTRLRA